MKREPPPDHPDFPPPLTAEELAAAVRFVAKEAPHLALELTWSIITNPFAMSNLRERDRDLIEPAKLAELADLDPLLEVAVMSSTSGYVRLKKYRLTLESGTADRSSEGQADPDVEADVARLAAWVHRVATERPDLLPAALAQLCGRTSSRLALRAYRAGAKDTLALRAFEQGVELDVESIVEADDESPEAR